jgi:hypothetical protein
MIEMKNDLNKLLIRIEENKKQFNYKAFENVLKKSKYINNIIISFSDFNHTINSEQIIELIMKNCNNLKSITFNFNEISDQLIENFGLKYGQKLREIRFIRDYRSDDHIIKYQYNKLLRLCPNLIALKGDLSLFVHNNQLLVPKLSSITTEVFLKDIQHFETFAKNYANCLKSITIRANYGLDENEINVLMRNLVHLKSLSKLEFELWVPFHFDDITNTNIFFDNFKSMAINCKQLKNFEFRILGIYESLIIQLFNCLGFFENLKVLHLNLYDYNQNSNEINCQSLKELKLLMKLKVEKLKMNDIFFEDIDKHLPQLKYLDIRVDNKITDKAMNSLSKLSKLKLIKIRCPEEIFEERNDILPLITDIGLLNIINNCPQINSIEFYSRPNISHKTIDALIALALRKPKTYFKHHFYDIGKSCFYASAKDIIFNVIDLKSYQLPNNLVID